MNRWKEVKPTDVLSALFALVSVGLALWALIQSEHTADDQNRFERDIEERQSAPVLAAGTELRQRGKRRVVYTENARVKKRADRLLIDSNAGRVVMPVRNTGQGVATLIREYAFVVRDCVNEPDKWDLPPHRERLGFYAVRPGESEQLGYLTPQTPRQFLELARQTRKRSYTDYSRVGKEGKPFNLVVRYTDALVRKLRWTCVSYKLAKRRGDLSEWSMESQIYDDRPWGESPASGG